MKIPLSWSRLSVHRQCPKQFESKFLIKTYPDESDNPAFKKGNEVHKQMENYIKFKKGLCKEPVLGKIAQQGKELIDHYSVLYNPQLIFAEKQFAFDDEYNEVGWYDKNIKWRVIIDMMIFNGERLMIFDFKTGKVRKYNDELGQLHLTANLMFNLYPEINEITCTYLFLEHKKSESVGFYRKENGPINSAFEIECYTINECEFFEPKKNKYCYFCGIKEDCIYG